MSKASENTAEVTENPIVHPSPKMIENQANIKETTRFKNEYAYISLTTEKLATIKRKSKE